MSNYVYLCLSCGERASHQLAQCPKCESWGTLVSRSESSDPSALAGESDDVVAISSARRMGHSALSTMTRIVGTAVVDPIVVVAPPRATPLAQVQRHGADVARMTTGYSEVDRVFGGGIVPSSPVLLGGEPGAGKSSLSLGIADRIARAAGQDVIYVTGEETAPQIAMRADRLGVTAERLSVVHETELERILALAERTMPSLLIVDSIQTTRSTGIPAEAGTSHQVRTCTAHLARFAKATKTPVLIVGHVNKDGEIAGPKTLEHLVDVVLYLDVAEGSRRHLSAWKNRYGDTAEVGLLEMTAAGLVDVKTAFAPMTTRRASAPGSVLCAAAFGERVAIVEIEALVGPPREGKSSGDVNATGVDRARVQRILAILARHAAIDVTDRNVYVSVAGGLRVADPCADLAIALAIASSARDVALGGGIAACGELALSGEVRRPIQRLEHRAAEAQRAGVLLGDYETLESALSAFATPKALPASIALDVDLIKMPPPSPDPESWPAPQIGAEFLTGHSL